MSGGFSRLLCLPAVLLVAGCGERPRAPALEDGSVYANEREGFRFLVPQGWVQQSKTALPPGPVPQERLLVLYRSFSSSPPSTLEVTLVDLPADVDLDSYLHDHPWSGQTWEVVRSEAVQAGDRPGRRFILRPAKGPARLAREVTAVRRGERVYFFNGTFPPDDTSARDQLRQLVAGVRWS